jgi:hypothetical protein
VKILFVAKHNSGDNDDEGAVTYALRQLGHEVTTVHELRRHRSTEEEAMLRQSSSFDFCLFFKWDTQSEIEAVRCPKAFWYFDMVRSVEDDPTLKARSDYRVEWMNRVIPQCLVGFCTDGDWVSHVNSMAIISDPLKNMNKVTHLKHGALIHLMQGADERYVGLGEPNPKHAWPDIVFTGMVNHGQKRAAHVAHLRSRYGDRFAVLGDGGPRHRLHGRVLADLFASVKVVVAPDGPNTDRYWSNRVYLTTGLGGLLIHPMCEGLFKHYSMNELMYYENAEHLDQVIDMMLTLSDEQRLEIRKAGLKAAIERNLYRHRCAQLIKEVEARL